jgi:hypothetical protein
MSIHLVTSMSAIALDFVGVSAESVKGNEEIDRHSNKRGSGNDDFD